MRRRTHGVRMRVSVDDGKGDWLVDSSDGRMGGRRLGRKQVVDRSTHSASAAHFAARTRRHVTMNDDI